MIEYYINSTNYSTKKRQTAKYGIVYDVIFRAYTLEGKQIQKRLSRYKSVPFTTKAMAKEGFLRFIKEKCELISGNPIKPKEDKVEYILGELFATYIMSLYNQNKESVIYDKQNVFNLFILPKFKNYEMSKLTKEELYLWQDELWSTRNPRTHEFYSYKYLSKTRGYFFSFLAWCEDRFGTPNNFKYVKKPKTRVQTTEMQIWDRKEFEQFISVVDNEEYKMLFTMLFYTGRRKSEVFALTPADIKKDRIVFNKTITTKTLDGSLYKVTSTKNEKNEISYICPTLQTALSHFKGKSPFFFGGNRPIADTTLTRAFNGYIEKAKVKRIRLHDLRHSFVSLCISKGASITTVAKLIGDSILQVTKTYAHAFNDEVKSVISQI